MSEQTDAFVIAAREWVGNGAANKRWWDVYHMETTLRSAMNGSLQTLNPAEIGRLHWLIQQASKGSNTHQGVVEATLALKRRLDQYEYPNVPYGAETEI